MYYKSSRGVRFGAGAADSCLVPFLLSPGAAAGPAAGFGRGVSARLRPRALQLLQQQPNAGAAAAPGHSRDSNRTKSNPGSKPNPGSRPNASPNRCCSLIVGRCQNAAGRVQYAAAKYFAKFPTLTVAGGRMCRYSRRAPWGFFDISTHDREQLRGRQATSRPSGHPPLLQTMLGTPPPDIHCRMAGSCSGRHP